MRKSVEEESRHQAAVEEDDISISPNERIRLGGMASIWRSLLAAAFWRMAACERRLQKGGVARRHNAWAHRN